VIRRWQVAAFGVGLIVVFVALITPLAALADALFSAHMVQHLLLILLAAPLLVLGAPLVPFLWALPAPARKRVGRWWQNIPLLRTLWRSLSQPLIVWLLYALTFWIWHLPTLYQAALEWVWVHELEHASFLLTALLFWWTVLHPLGGHKRLGYGAGALYLFTTALHSSALGALLTFAERPLYPIYVSSVAAWNLTLLEDQQLAGVIMWVPAGVVYPTVALVLLGIWLQRMEDRPATMRSIRNSP
jgi:cytochrome c oxidase assembly factor CtaG